MGPAGKVLAGGVRGVFEAGERGRARAGRRVSVGLWGEVSKVFKAPRKRSRRGWWQGLHGASWEGADGGVEVVNGASWEGGDEGVPRWSLGPCGGGGGGCRGDL